MFQKISSLVHAAIFFRSEFFVFYIALNFLSGHVNNKVMDKFDFFCLFSHSNKIFCLLCYHMKRKGLLTKEKLNNLQKMGDSLSLYFPGLGIYSSVFRANRLFFAKK